MKTRENIVDEIVKVLCENNTKDFVIGYLSSMIGRSPPYTLQDLEARLKFIKERHS